MIVLVAGLTNTNPERVPADLSDKPYSLLLVSISMKPSLSIVNLSPATLLAFVTNAMPTFEELSLIKAIELLTGVVVPAILNLPFLAFVESGTKPATISAESSAPISIVVEEPSTSKKSPPEVPTPTLLLNIAAPASDISRVSAVITEPPSLPLNTISPS